MSKHELHGKLQAAQGQGHQLAEILLKAAALVSTAPGCRLYMVSRDPADPDTVWITEAWDSEADHAQSLKIAGVRELINQAMPILSGPPSGGQKLEVLGGYGVDGW